MSAHAEPVLVPVIDYVAKAEQCAEAVGLSHSPFLRAEHMAMSQMYATLAVAHDQRIRNLIAYLAIMEGRGVAGAEYRALDQDVRDLLGLGI